MAEDMLACLEQGFENLVAALEGQDPDLIIQAAAAIQPLVTEIEEMGVGSGRGSEMIRTEATVIKDRLTALSKLIDSARFRVNKLTDLNQQRAINLSRALGSASIPTYTKPR